MEKIRILHILHQYLPECRGGVERSVEWLSARQSEAGFDCRIVCGSSHVTSKPTLESSEHGGLPIHRMYRGPGFRDSIDGFRADIVPLFERVLSEFRPHIVHLHHWMNLGDDLVRRSVRNGARAIVTLYDFHSTCALTFRDRSGEPCDLPQEADHCAPCIGPRTGLDESEVKFRVETRRDGFLAELRAASFVTVPSDSHRSALARHVPSDIKLQVVGLATSSIGTTAPRRPDGILNVLHFGNLCRLKGIDVLLAAVKLANADRHRVDLHLAGRIIEPDLELQGATVLGEYDSSELPGIAARADIAAFPSLARESYGLVVDEALRLGLPVLVSDRGALADRVGHRGLALPARDAAAWARELIRLADEPGALAALRGGSMGPLSSLDEQGARIVGLYRSALDLPLPEVDIEGPLLRRLAHVDQVLGDIVERACRG